MSPCLVTVSQEAAFRWLRGDLSDRDLLWASTLAPEAIFAVNLPPGTLRAGLRRRPVRPVR